MLAVEPRTSGDVLAVGASTTEPADDDDVLATAALAAAMDGRKRELAGVVRGGEFDRLAGPVRPVAQATKRLALAVLRVGCPPGAMVGAAEVRIVPASAA
jgi:hypothetical protein